MTLETPTSDWPGIVNGLKQTNKLAGIPEEDLQRLLNYSEQIGDIPIADRRFQSLSQGIHALLRKYLGEDYLRNFNPPASRNRSRLR